MFRLKAAVPFILIFNAIACKTSNSGSQTKDVEGHRSLETISMVTCDRGELNYFKMIPAKHDKVYTTEDFPKIPGYRWNLHEIYDDTYFRLDVCLDGDIATLKQVVRSFGSRYFDVIKPTAAARINGLFEAMTGDYSKLDIFIPHEKFRYHSEDGSREWDAADQVFTLRGALPGKGNLAVTAELYQVDQEFGSGGDHTYYGVLEYEEPVAAGSCKARGTMSGRLEYGTVTIEWHGKMGTGGVDGPAPSWCSITVTDTSPKAGSFRNVPFHMEFDFHGFDEVTKIKVFDLMYTHHSKCNTLWFKTPFAEYSYGPPNEHCTAPEFAKFAKYPKNARIQYGADIVETEVTMDRGGP